eukprot:CAMPEP_0176259148 /NCGR_PEP_ID=MMETSP0121_2-20121125/38926_1 /TAXON_ID=160619 /ORGANISM="Kryptoperidinium foliaceum, Strain CCMP 1326" /LENGTH=88 /DNA_ID=CAMNT_0017599035 /DNA_START=36 /DNA_END=299 /DNA_ORIENTATION=-
MSARALPLADPRGGEPTPTRTSCAGDVGCPQHPRSAIDLEEHKTRASSHGPSEAQLRRHLEGMLVRAEADVQVTRPELDLVLHCATDA